MSETTITQSTVIKTDKGLSITGTRITLAHIMDYLKADWPPHLIQQWFSLTDEQINDVMDYIDTHQDEVEAEYQQVLQLAEESRRYWADYHREKFPDVAAPEKVDKAAIRAKIEAKKAALEMK